MNRKDLFRKRREIINKYYSMENQSIHPKRNVFKLHANATIEHEIGKLRVCYELKRRKHNFITEAVKRSIGGKVVRVDVVDLDTGYEYEVETDPKRAERFNGSEVIVVKLWGEKLPEKYVDG